MSKERTCGHCGEYHMRHWASCYSWRNHYRYDEDYSKKLKQSGDWWKRNGDWKKMEEER